MNNLKNIKKFFEQKNELNAFDKLYNWFKNNQDIIDDIDYDEEGNENIKIIIDDNSQISININGNKLLIYTVENDKQKYKEIETTEENITKLRKLLNEIK